jgi:hypothetical protein
MPYLDVSPMMGALRTMPQEFELANGWLHHIRSQHSFRFSHGFRLGANDHIEIRASCDCALLAVRPEQEPQLAACFREWEASYWAPLQINREFASHFARRPGVLPLLAELAGRLYRWLLRQDRARGRYEAAETISPVS